MSRLESRKCRQEMASARSGLATSDACWLLGEFREQFLQPHMFREEPPAARHQRCPAHARCPDRQAFSDVHGEKFVDRYVIDHADLVARVGSSDDLKSAAKMIRPDIGDWRVTDPLVGSAAHLAEEIVRGRGWLVRRVGPVLQSPRRPIWQWVLRDVTGGVHARGRSSVRVADLSALDMNATSLEPGNLWLRPGGDGDGDGRDRLARVE